MNQREDEVKALLNVRWLTEIEEEVNEISDIIEIEKSQNRDIVTINDDLHPKLLERLISIYGISWYKKPWNIFWTRTVLILK